MLTITANLIDAVVSQTIPRSLSAQQFCELFESRTAEAREVLGNRSVNGQLLEARGWDRWQGNRQPIWMLGSPRILWTVDKGLVLFFGGKMISEQRLKTEANIEH